MRTSITYLVLSLLTLALLLATPATASTSAVQSLRSGIQWQRSATWHLQDRAGVARTPTRYVERRSTSEPFLRWVDRLWMHRRLAARKLAARTSGSVPTIICRVFGSQCSYALVIAKRESGFSTHPYPPNPTHFGIFQLDSSALRSYATIGYSTAYQQVVAAHNMFLARGWEPWTCCE